MSLIVENGTGLSTAESYISVADADTYFASFGTPTSWSSADTTAKENAIRSGAQYLDLKYGRLWPGYKVLTTQRLDWPRYDVHDESDILRDYDSLPRELVEANAEAALLVIDGESLFPSSQAGTIKREKVSVGPILSETEYVGGKTALKRYRKVEALIRKLIGGGSGMGVIERG